MSKLQWYGRCAPSQGCCWRGRASAPAGKGSHDPPFQRLQNQTERRVGSSKHSPAGQTRGNKGNPLARLLGRFDRPSIDPNIERASIILGPNPGQIRGQVGVSKAAKHVPNMDQVWTLNNAHGDHPRHQPRWQPDTMSDGKRRLSVRLRWQLEDIRIVE